MKITVTLKIKVIIRHLLNSESLHSEDNSEPPYTSVQPEEEHHDQSDASQTHSITAREGLLLKTGQVVTYTDRENGQPHTGKVFSRAGKATGAYKNWYNLKYTEPEEIVGKTGSVDLEQVDNLQVLPSEHAEICADCYKDYILIVNDDAFMQVKHTELSNWKRNDVFEEMKDEGQKCISTRWKNSPQKLSLT